MMMKMIISMIPKISNTGKRQLRMKSMKLALVKALPDELMTMPMSSLTMNIGIDMTMAVMIWKLHISGRDWNVSLLNVIVLVLSIICIRTPDMPL